jgi:hypothetical protein
MGDRSFIGGKYWICMTPEQMLAVRAGWQTASGVDSIKLSPVQMPSRHQRYAVSGSNTKGTMTAPARSDALSAGSILAHRKCHVCRGESGGEQHTKGGSYGKGKRGTCC